MSITITTNNVPRFTVDPYQLTDTERADLDIVDVDDASNGATYIRYQGDIYPVADFQAVSTLNPDGAGHHDLRGWDGYLTDSMWTGLVIRWADDSGESVVVGRFMVTD